MIKKGVFFSFIVCFVATHSAFTRDFLTVPNLLKAATEVTPQTFPDSDDVLLDDYIQVRYQPDGTSETWDDTAIKILTEKGKRDNRSLSLRFNTAYGTNRFEKVEVIKPDGTVNTIDIAAQSKVMVDPGQMSANIYNPNSKILQLSVPGLEVGDILRYVSHEIRSKTVVPDSWSDYQVFEHTSPIAKMTYEVIAPRSLPLKNIALKAEIPGTVSHEKREMEESIVYTWRVSNVPRMFPEPNMPESYTVAQRLLVSTIDTWEHLSDWYWELCKPRLAATTPEMEEKALELTANCTTLREKVNAIFKFVSQDIRYMGITTEDTAPGYEPHDVKMTFENRHGVCRDKAALLASMLRLAGIEAFPVIIMAGPKKDEEVPQPFFNHAVTAALDEDGSYILMDSTDENTKDIFPAYLQNMSYLVARPGGETLLTSPLIPASENRMDISTVGSLDPNGNLSAKSTLVFGGVNDTLYRGHFSQIKPEERKRFFEGQIKKGMPTAELTELEILPTELRDTTQPLTVNLTFTADNLLVRGEHKNMLNLPRLGASLGFANYLIGQTGLDLRKYPLYTRITAGIEERLELQLPENSGKINLPDYTQIDTPQLQWHKTIRQENGKLFANALFELNTVEFLPEEYLTLKQNLKEIEYNNRKKLILDAPPAVADENSDIRIITSDSIIELKDAQSWTETYRTKLEIRTYAGTKKYSEITESYNPIWETVELKRATVTQPDGTVKTIEPEAINIMDAGWVASAPRYPAEKILVANLPSVEVGSIIEYETVRTVSGKPFYCAQYAFNSFEPIDSATYTLTAPTNLPLQIKNNGITETQTTSDGTITYRWTAKDQPAVKKEEQLPDWWTFNPTIFISTSNWENYADAVQTRLAAATQNQPATEALAKTLTEGRGTKTKQVIAIRDWVAKNIKTVGPAFVNLPLSVITPADQTLTDRYGHNADRMIVLYTLLNAAGLEPQFLLSGSLSLIPEAAQPLLDVPDYSAFPGLIVHLELGGQPLYLSGESQYAQLGTTPLEHRAALNLATAELTTITPPKQFAQKDDVKIDLRIDAKGKVKLTKMASVYGSSFENFHRMFAEITPEKRRRYYLELVSGLSQSATAESELITDYTIYPGKTEYTIGADRYAVIDGDHLYFTLPGGLGGLLKYRSSERENPLAWNGYINNKLTYTITLPEGYKPVILPTHFQWMAPGDAGSITVDVQTDGNTITMVQQANLKPAIIPATDYPGLIAAGKKLAHPDMSTILLERKK